ncbi:13264_t:CDS:1, partial [Racocetra persica]
NTPSKCQSLLDALTKPTSSNFYLTYKVNLCEQCEKYFTNLFMCQDYNALLEIP